MEEPMNGKDFSLLWFYSIDIVMMLNEMRRNAGITFYVARRGYNWAPMRTRMSWTTR